MKLLFIYLSIMPLLILNQTLLHSIVINRHGARTNSEYFSKKMFPDYSPQQLTNEGKMQCKQKGVQYQQYLKEQQLSVNNSTDYLVYSSPSDRTLLSIINYVAGSLDETDYQINYEGIKLNKTNQQSKSQIIDEQQQQYVINSIEEKMDFYFHADSLCPSIKELVKEYKEDLQIEIEKMKKDLQIKSLIESLNSNFLLSINKQIQIQYLSGKQLSSIRDLYISAQFHSKLDELPQINEEQWDKLYLFKRFYSFDYKYKHRLVNQLSIYFQFRDLIQFLNKVQDTLQPYKLWLQSSHDNQMANLINILFYQNTLFQNRQLYAIPYATNIQFDIFSFQSNLYVQPSINSIPLQLKACTYPNIHTFLCPLNTFISILSNINDIQFWNQCFNPTL